MSSPIALFLTGRLVPEPRMCEMMGERKRALAFAGLYLYGLVQESSEQPQAGVWEARFGLTAPSAEER